MAQGAQASGIRGREGAGDGLVFWSAVQSHRFPTGAKALEKGIGCFPSGNHARPLTADRLRKLGSGMRSIGPRAPSTRHPFLFSRLPLLACWAIAPLSKWRCSAAFQTTDHKNLMEPVRSGVNGLDPSGSGLPSGGEDPTKDSSFLQKCGSPSPSSSLTGCGPGPNRSRPPRLSGDCRRRPSRPGEAALPGPVPPAWGAIVEPDRKRPTPL